MVIRGESLQDRAISVTTEDGARRAARLTVCPACKGETWVIFQIEGHDHIHIQCAECGTSYCPKGAECWG